jgi:dihydrofolate reductase
LKINLIWAQDENGGIGKKNQLPWSVSEDLRNFKKLTLNRPIIMGRLTWESLPVKPLPMRRNIIITSHHIPDQECYSKINECIQQLENEDIENIFVIGGASIYRSFYPIATDLHITIINKLVRNIDTYFPVTLDNIKSQWTINYTEQLSEIAQFTQWIKIHNKTH